MLKKMSEAIAATIAPNKNNIGLICSEFQRRYSNSSRANRRTISRVGYAMDSERARGLSPPFARLDYESQNIRTAAIIIITISIIILFLSLADNRSAGKNIIPSANRG